MAAGDVIRMVRNVIVDGQTCVNVLHFLDVNGADENPEEALLDAWDPPVGPPNPISPEDEYNICQEGFTSYTYVSLTAQRIFPVEGEAFSRAFNRPKGPAVDSGLPTFSQLKITLGTDLISRSGRGGFFMPAIAERDTTGNTLTGGILIAQMGDFINAIEQVHTAGGVEFSGYAIGVFSRLLQEFNAATVLGFKTTLGTMVSRRAGRGT